ncbi:hypothetical protein Lalb_Chr24g0397511 [Lupinus albus]|uniref:Uncharacterized protein n=1 Tax=Lupinus albus TaxID=3870 RepID=A0A6A4N7C8_LUPAL|nr:hypothetical protein Lalb_Chr24g0397511 [Lupinus albus]
MEEGEECNFTPNNVMSSEVVASEAETTSLDVPAKKLARQLDFTASQSQPQLQSLMPQPVVVMPVLRPLPHPSVRVGDCHDRILNEDTSLSMQKLEFLNY